MKNQYAPFIEYFEKRGFGTELPVLTILSYLPLIDRCNILKELQIKYPLNVEVYNKYMLALLKIGKYEDALQLLENAKNSNFITFETYYILKAKLNSLNISLDNSYSLSIDYGKTIMLVENGKQTLLNIGALEMCNEFNKIVLDFCYNQLNSDKMTTVQEICSVLFLEETLEKARILFNENKTEIIFEKYNISFRLFKASEFNINLEFHYQLITDNFDNNLNLGNLRESFIFWKPVGFYTEDKSSDNNLMINILKEFEDEIDFLINHNKIIPTSKINKLSIRENALIAAFSKETMMKAILNEDCFSFYANGLLLDIYMTIEGYPEVFLDDKYETYGAIAKYRLYDNPPCIDPIITYDNIFDKMFEMKLVTAFR